MVVGTKFRTHELSKTKGGYNVTVYKKDKQVLTYIDVKKPRFYVPSITKNHELDSEILRITVNKEEVWNTEIGFTMDIAHHFPDFGEHSVESNDTFSKTKLNF